MNKEEKKRRKSIDMEHKKFRAQLLQETDGSSRGRRREVSNAKRVSERKASIQRVEIMQSLSMMKKKKKKKGSLMNRNTLREMSDKGMSRGSEKETITAGRGKESCLVPIPRLTLSSRHCLANHQKLFIPKSNHTSTSSHFLHCK